MDLNPSAFLVAGSALGLFVYFILGFAVVVGGSEVLPKWIRAFLTPSELVPKPWPLKALSLVWVIPMMTLSLWVIAAAAEQYDGQGSRLVILVALLLMAGWTIFLWTLYRRPRP